MILEQLSNARGVSGDEGAVREIISAEVESCTDERRVDALGNLICLKRGEPGTDRWPRRVMLAAHMDEIGLIVTGINSDGTLRFGKVGGIDDRILLSKRVLVGEDAVPGVLGFPPIHLIPATERAKAPKADRLSIDIGATSKEKAERIAKPGDYVSFDVDYQALHQDGLRPVKGKAFDDRAGCAVLVELLRDEYAFDLYGTFTTQEEVGLRGARVAASSVVPDVAFVFEGTICDDLPKQEDVSPVTELGKGPAISIMDRSFIADERLVRLLVDTAERLGIPHQFKRAVARGTDAGAIHLSGEGVPSAALSVPTRYIHAPVSLLSLSDFDYTVRLMREALHTLEGGLAS